MTELLDPVTPAPVDDIIHHRAESAYLLYSLAVVKGRALADVEDGQKPVQRRILYAMHRLGLGGSAKPVKSARIIGEVLGKYHPHGDQAAYDAMVRQAQTFTLRYPLIDGQGNYGTLDGDNAAAMRYTEARLSPIAELMLSELDQGTVDFIPNYDGQEQEPSLLPARLPFILLNGTSGIAVGMAAEIPSHNLREVAAAACLLVEKPDADLDEVLEHIKGPDFPGGGQVVSTPAQIREAYRTGRASLRSRARWVREDLARGQWQIVVTELPFRVSTRKILEELDALTNPQPPAGKKTLTQEQENLKRLALEFLEKAVDESDKDNPVRLVLGPRTSKIDPEQMMAFLLANTSLEDSVPFNFTVIGLDAKPQTKGLLAILGEWADFRVATVRRRTDFELEVANKRIHVLEGRHTVFLNLDAVIKVIREADEPKTELMARFALSEIQANDILEMRLRQLNKLEGFKLERELEELRAEAARLQVLLDSEPALRALVVTEIRAAATKYGDERRTLIEVPPAVAIAAQTVPDEEITVVISKNLWIKAYRGHGVPQESFSFKTGDAVLAVAETRTVGAIYILDSKGRCYQVNGAQVPVGRGDGAPLSTLVDIQDGASIVAVLHGHEDTLFLFGGIQGKGFISPLRNLATKQRAGKVFLKLAQGEPPFRPVSLPPRAGEAIPGFIVCGSTKGRMLAFAPGEVNEYVGGVQGVGLMALDDGETLASVQHAGGTPFSCKIVVNGRTLAAKLSGEEWEKHVAHRARKGAFLPKKGILQG